MSTWPSTLADSQNPIGLHVLNAADEVKPAVWTGQPASVVVGIVSNTRDGSLPRGVATTFIFH